MPELDARYCAAFNYASKLAESRYWDGNDECIPVAMTESPRQQAYQQVSEGQG
jgi:hypothetical protein